ncbi:hypothetical protein FEM48_Zijuj12G0193600 [Ziziphus jujuba var. spinosa]|uniref:Uncharacterized protein n=1 Tax=Ziziphus jujuba var. spinosa TaxID=714518 RepID=A0A978UF34_ZIZJJ|nr:hypothetical protein FEM48_Zijuj12G0193600 [Ziziphus jujuba var. spinosa]
MVVAALLELTAEGDRRWCCGTTGAGLSRAERAEGDGGGAEGRELSGITPGPEPWNDFRMLQCMEVIIVPPIRGPSYPRAIKLKTTLVEYGLDLVTLLLCKIEEIGIANGQEMIINVAEANEANGPPPSLQGQIVNVPPQPPVQDHMAEAHGHQKDAIGMIPVAVEIVVPPPVVQDPMIVEDAINMLNFTTQQLTADEVQIPLLEQIIQLFTYVIERLDNLGVQGQDEEGEMNFIIQVLHLSINPLNAIINFLDNKENEVAEELDKEVAEIAGQVVDHNDDDDGNGGGDDSMIGGGGIGHLHANHHDHDVEMGGDIEQ